jgi:hypothetical protein
MSSQQQINVILASSDYSFPYKLRDPRLHFKTGDITKLIFCGEVPPNQMYSLLTNTWKVGPNLSMALMDHFGGHIWDTYKAVSDLAIRKEKFRPSGVWDPSAPMEIAEALAMKDVNYQDRKRMNEMLIQLAQNGFVPLHDNKPLLDPVARKISENNIGGVVKKGSIIVGLPDTVWNDGE